MSDTPASILVVDDEASITEFVSYNLRKEGYDVAVAATGDEALALAKDHAFDLVVLDVMLPGIDGYEVCRRLRADSSVPVLFLSARDTELDKVVGLEIGGDDYLAKPFGVRELQARVKALLRRAPSGAREPGVAGEHIELAGIVLDEGAHTAESDGKLIDLTPREFELLACLMRHSGKVLSRDVLLRLSLRLSREEEELDEHADLRAQDLGHDRHRHDHREVLERTLVVVLHRQHGARAVAHEHDLGRVVEHLRAGTADVESAERIGAVGRKCRREHGQHVGTHGATNVPRSPTIYRAAVSRGASTNKVSVGAKPVSTEGSVREPPGT